MKSGDLWFFVDESGKPDVLNLYGIDLLAAGTTSTYLVLAAVRTDDAARLRATMRNCIAWADSQFGTGRGGHRVTELHARADRPVLRNHVISELVGLPIKATAIAMDKRLLDPARDWRTDRTRFYNEMAALLLANTLHLYTSTHIVFSHKNHDTMVDLQAMTQTIARRWAVVLRRMKAQATQPARATQARPRADPALYAADYVAWTVNRAFQQGDMSYFTRMQPILSHVWDLARLQHYTRKNPMRNPP